MQSNTWWLSCLEIVLHEGLFILSVGGLNNADILLCNTLQVSSNTNIASKPLILTELKLSTAVVQTQAPAPRTWFCISTNTAVTQQCLWEGSWWGIPTPSDPTPYRFTRGTMYFIGAIRPAFNKQLLPSLIWSFTPAWSYIQTNSIHWLF